MIETRATVGGSSGSRLPLGEPAMTFTTRRGLISACRSPHFLPCCAPRGTRPAAGLEVRRGGPPRRARDVRPRPAVPGREADREGRLDRRRIRGRPGPRRPRPDGLPGLGRGPQLRPLQQPRPEGAPRASSSSQDADTGIMGHEHVSPRLRHARPGRGLRRGRRAQPLARRRRAAVDRPGPGAGRPRGDHLAEEELAGRLAVLARRHRRRHVGQRRGARRPAGGPQRRHRGARRVDRQGDRLLQVDDRPVRPGGLRRAAWAGSTSRSPGSRSRTLVYAVARRKDLPRIQGDPRLPQAADRPAEPRSSTWNTPAITRPRRSSRATSTPGRSGTSCWSGSSSRPRSPTAASRASSARRSPRRCRCWPWRSITASCPSTNGKVTRTCPPIARGDREPTRLRVFLRPVPHHRRLVDAAGLRAADEPVARPPRPCST